jgi:hypothetical protein
MRHFFAGCLLLAITLPCPAQGDKAKPNTLTPKEIADGWILLFDGETTFGWKLDPSRKGQLKVADGVLSMDAAEGVIQCTTSFVDFELRVEYKCKVAGLGVFAVDGTINRIERVMPKNETDWSTMVLRLSDGEAHIERASGKEKLRAWNGPTTVYFDQSVDGNLQLRNIKLRPRNTKSLFNGKDLTGWKEFPGKKSKFAVIDGAINVKDGPGDLQTVGKYKDFILQLECISNGKHLNSGIFFRCRDNEYQNGYEAQIRNQFTPEATQDYTIEEYDPKTNKLIGKNKIKSTAVDYGTGAIYRRQPARKEMAKDGEWFGMTIVAHGNHLTTWVNGVQVTDWHDNRPKSDNARTGCKLEAGHISIQGHDPTTNLSFRNFRIAELK